MSDQLTAEAPADAAPYASLEELKAEHSTLLRRRRGGFDDNPSAFLGEVETFLKRGYATGRILGDEAERYSAQSLLTYWSNVLYREGREVPEDALAEYDPGQAPELADTECPYVGLGQQQEGDLPLRSPGWSRLIDESLKVIEKERFLAVVGANGSGRHPLIHGGILPALRNGAIQGSEDWRILPSLVPGADPLSELLRHLHPEADTTWIERQLADLRANPASLAGWSDDGDQRPVVLVIERFGELFDQSDRTQIQPFAEALLALAQDPNARHIIILGTRPDNLSLISAIGGFGKLFQRNQVLMSFTNRELRQMVEEPAKRVGLKYDDGVVDRLLLDVQGDPAALTLLQFNLQLLWKNRQGNRITHEIYDGIGGGRLAVARQAERVYSSLSPEQQKAVKLAFLKLVRVESGTRVILQRVPRRQLVFPEVSSGVMNAALDRLIDGQTLVSREGPGSGESSLRLVHEAAATAWPRCVEWLDEFRARHRWQLGLRTAAEQWRDKGKNCGALWRGGALEQAGRERARFLAEGGVLSPLEEQFLDASQKAEKRGIWLKRGLITLAIAGLVVIAMLGLLLARQEKLSKQELGLAISRWSTAVARWLDEAEGDSTGAFVWLGEAWNRLLDNKESLESDQSEDLMRDYRLCLGMALRRLPRISRLLDHKDLVASAVSGDRSWAASVGLDGTVKQWKISEGTSESWRLTKAPIMIKNARVSISPDGNYVVVCTSDSGSTRQVLVSDIAAKPVKTNPLPYDRPVMMAEFCPRSRETLLATVGELEKRKVEIRLWRVGTWEAERADALDAPGIIKHIAISQDGSRLAAAGKNENGGSGFCREWDWTQPRMSVKDYPLPSGYGRKGDASYVAYHCDANGKPLRLAVACGEEDEDQTYVYVFDVGDTVKGQNLFPPHRGAVNQVSFSPDGKKLVTAGQDGTARIWVIGQGPMQSRTLFHGSSVLAAEFSLDGQFVATASDLRPRVWDAETGEPVSCPLQHSGPVDYAKFTSDGRQLITQSPDMLHVWDFWPRAEPPFQFAVPWSIDHVCCDPKTLRVAAAGYQPAHHQGWARVWDGKDGKQLTPELLHPERVTRLALSPNGGPFLATVCEDSALRVWNTGSGQQTCAPTRFAPDQLRCVTFSPDGTLLVAAGGDHVARRGVARVYSVSSEGKLTPEKLELRDDAPINIVVFDPKGDRFVTVTGDSSSEPGKAKIWNRTGNSIEWKGKESPAHSQGIKSAAFSGDGQLLVTTSSDNSARVWNVHDGSLVQALEGHTAEVVSASFSESGEYVATSSRDGKAIVWKLDSRKPFALLPHKKPVNQAIFTRDTRYVVTACEDGAARIWAIGGGGHPVAIRRQSGTVMQVGYTGEDSSSTIGIFSLRSPSQSSASPCLPQANQLPPSLEYNVGVGAWDISPGAEPSVGPLLSFGKAIAARRTLISSGEVKLETISGDELKKAWEDSLPLADVLLGPTAGQEEWHDRMARVFEANRRWEAAVWHLDRLASEPRAPVTTYLRRARAHSELGRTEKRPDSPNLSLALKDYSRVLDAEPGNGPIYLERAEIQLDLQNLDEALKDFSKAEQLVGGTKRVWTGRAKARSRQQLWQPAIEDYLKALQADPGDGSVHGQLAEAYFNLKDWKKAIEEFGQAAQKLPNNLEFKERRADAVLELKDLPQAIKEYAEVAANYRRQRQFNKAIDIYRKALNLKPERNVGRLHAELAETYSMEGHLDEAIAEYNEALKREPAEWRYWQKLAALHEKLGAWTEAKQAYSKAIDLTPGELTPLLARARLFTHLKQWDLAAQDYETAVKSDPKKQKPWLRTELAGLYVEAGKWDEAIRCFEKVAEESPNANDVMPYMRVATIQLMRGDTGGYQATCERLLGRFEQVKNVETANNAAWACALGPSAVKDMGRAVRLAKWAVENQPGNSNYRNTLGAVHYRAGDMEATIRELSQSKSPFSPSSSFRPGLTVVYDRLYLAMALHRSRGAEEAKEAKELLEAAIEQLETNWQNQSGSPTAPAIDPWQRRELKLLRTEAENLIKPKR